MSRARQTRPESDGISPRRIRNIRRRLLDWYDGHRRDLPWRRLSGDPYAQWVAEVMLQQTQVETVRAYYERFLRRFPDVAALGAASLDDVLKHWEGLGYYRRAVHLHRAAQQVMADGGSLPRSSQGLRALPGIGRYTSAAIASIAYGEPVAAVDGNVVRVLSRVFAVSTDRVSPRAAERARRVATMQRVADQLLDPHRPGDFNQALMDLGATVCRPRQPVCTACPLKRLCRGRPVLGGLQPISVTAPVPRVIETVLLARHGEDVFMRQRPADGLWSGLWELPSRDALRMAEPRSLAGWLRVLGLRRIGIAEACDPVEHRLTHRLYEFRPIVVEAKDARRHPPRTDSLGRWIDPAERERLAISTAHRNVLTLVGERA